MGHDRITLFTWQDVERTLYTYRSNWPKGWKNIEVFSTELCIYTEKADKIIENETNQFLKQLFKNYFMGTHIRIPITDSMITVSLYEFDDNSDSESRQPFPLFKDFLYVSGENDIH